MSHNKGSITENAVFFRVNFGVFGNSKQVSSKDVLKASVLSESVTSKLLKIQKTLLESPELEAIKKADGKIRAFLYDHCLPYTDMGIMLLSTSGSDLQEVEDKCNEYIDIREGLVNAFVEAYPQRVNEARAKTQTLAEEIGVPFDVLWTASAYPSAEAVKSKFRFDWQYMSFETPEALKLKGLYESEKQKAAAKMAVAAEEITVLMRSTLAELVNHLKTALEPTAEGKKKKLHATAITNVQEFIKSFADRNLANDADLEKLVNEVSSLITPGMDIDTLKKDEAYKAQILAGMTALGSQLTELAEAVPGRKYKG